MTWHVFSLICFYFFYNNKTTNPHSLFISTTKLFINLFSCRAPHCSSLYLVQKNLTKREVGWGCIVMAREGLKFFIFPVKSSLEKDMTNRSERYNCPGCLFTRQNSQLLGLHNDRLSYQGNTVGVDNITFTGNINTQIPTIVGICSEKWYCRVITYCT